MVAFAGAERMTIMCPVCRLQCQTANMIDQRFVIEKIASDPGGNNGRCTPPTPCISLDAVLLHVKLLSMLYALFRFYFYSLVIVISLNQNFTF